MMNTKIKRSCAAFVLTFFSLTSITAASTLRTVALTGEVAPGAPTGVNFSTLATPVLNNSGQIAFSSSLSGTGVTNSNDLGVFSEGGGSGLSLVVREGDPAPGTGSGVNFSFSFLAFPVLNNAGQIAFESDLAGTGVNGSNDIGIFSGGGSSGLSLAVRAGDSASGTGNGISVRDFLNIVFNDAGQIAFEGRLAGTGVNGSNNRGIFSTGGGSGLSLVARSGDPAPGTESGVNFSGLIAPYLNNAGQTAFFGSLTGTGVNSRNSSGIFSEGGGNGLSLVARSGDPAPGTENGVNFGGLGGPVALNDSGEIAFLGALAGTGVNGSNSIGIFSEGGGNGLSLVARAGDPAPGTGSGVNFLGFDTPLLNGAGENTFVGNLTGTGVTSSNDRGIFSEGGGNGLSLVAREGDPAPGTGSGVNFSVLFGSAINGAGQTAFLGDLAGMGVTSSNDRGIWAEDRDGNLQLIAREGDLLDVNDDPLIDDFRTISFLSFFGNTGNQDGRRSGFNDLGQLAFLALFTDGTRGVFVSDLVAVPEPSTLLLTTLTLPALLRRRR